MDIADKMLIMQLFTTKEITAYGISQKLNNKISETMIRRYINGLNPEFNGQASNQADVGKITLDNAILITDIAAELLGSSIKNRNEISIKLDHLENLLSGTSDPERQLKIKASIEALNWVLSGTRSRYIF